MSIRWETVSNSPQTVEVYLLGRTPRQAHAAAMYVDLCPVPGYKLMSTRVSRDARGGKRRRITFVLRHCDSRVDEVSNWTTCEVIVEADAIARGVPHELR